MSTTTETLGGATERVDREPTISRSAERGSEETLLGAVADVLRTLGGVALAMVVVWLIVMFFRHLTTVAFVLAGVLAAIGIVELIRRDRSIPR